MKLNAQQVAAQFFWLDFPFTKWLPDGLFVREGPWSLQHLM
jgi:hypothetical protein